MPEIKPLYKAEKAPEDGSMLVYFWASWCPDCREKLAKPLPDLQKELKTTKLLTINTDRKAKRGLAYAEKNDLKVAVFRDESKKLMQQLKLFAVPAWALLKKNAAGKWVAHAASTGSDLELMKQKIGEL